ncbi:hypothetical protein SDC9_136393 [bioreactor metagenome]|uniref:Uncharacterized protein n=1 Tax=bioreactor metagenome TaxID=1076179 RepID=A0A645DJ60_9ZZZZ|nr:hypothetical protein [Oscillospiraceae bacterium]
MNKALHKNHKRKLRNSISASIIILLTFVLCLIFIKINSGTAIDYSKAPETTAASVSDTSAPPVTDENQAADNTGNSTGKSINNTGSTANN